MDNPYTSQRLARATLDLCRRIRRNNPELWAQIQAAAAKREQEAQNDGSDD